MRNTIKKTTIDAGPVTRTLAHDHGQRSHSRDQRETSWSLSRAKDSANARDGQDDLTHARTPEGPGLGHLPKRATRAGGS